MTRDLLISDLDGTLLDGSYRYDAALPALRALLREPVTLALCSSKTRAEMVPLAVELGSRGPLIVENGGALLLALDDGWEEFLGGEPVRSVDGYHLLALGERIDRLRAELADLRRAGFAVRGFGEMSAGEIALATGLSAARARLAREREFDECFFFDGTEEELRRLKAAIAARGLRHTRGRLHHLLGDHDKGRALARLRAILERRYGEVRVTALGDGENDLPMLERADVAVVLRQPDEIGEPALARRLAEHGALHVPAEPGPRGWNAFVLDWLSRTRAGDP